MAEYDYLIKLLIIGDSGVGKSCLLYRFTDDAYSDSYISTIGVDFKIRTVEVDGKIAKLQIWDTAGQERFRTITTSYYRGAHGIILCYSTTDRTSFINLEQWRKECIQYAPDGAPIIICGTKCDVVNNKQVSTEEGQKYAENYNYKFVETSAKTAVNVEQLFFDIAQSVVDTTRLKPHTTNVVLTPVKTKPQSNCC